MNKKFVTILIVLVIASTAIFATGRQQGGSPLYEVVSEGVYMNVETGETISAEELPTECKLVDGEDHPLPLRNQELRRENFPRKENSNNQNHRSVDESRSLGRNSLNRNNSRKVPHSNNKGHEGFNNRGAQFTRSYQNR